MANHNNFRVSVINWCQARISDMKVSGIMASTGVYFDFDAMGDVKDVPKVDLLGMMNFHWSNDQHFYTIGFSLGISTWDDSNLFRHNDIIDYIEPLLRPLEQLPVLDARTGANLGWMVIERGVTLMPMAKTETRGLQFFMLSLQSSVTV